MWLSSRSRLQLDDPRRRIGHVEPFIAEDGCAVYLPEDYFHLKPTKTIRLGRFTCIPVAQPLPSAQDALDSLSEASGLEVVPLRSLRPKELAQNTGLPNQEAELARQRDFDELFFFAGATDSALSRFKSIAQQQKVSLREHGVFWSIAVGADVRRCIREVGDLFDRSLRSHANRFAIATVAESVDIFPACDRGVRLIPSTKSAAANVPGAGRFNEHPMTSPGLWDTVIEEISAHS